MTDILRTKAMLSFALSSIPKGGKKCTFYLSSLKMQCHLKQNKLSDIGPELEQDRCKGVEMRELNYRNIYFTGHLHLSGT